MVAQQVQENWFENIFIEYGDYKLAKSFVGKDGETAFTKHRLYSESTPDQIKQATHRSPTPSELFIDLDYPSDMSDADKENVDYVVYQYLQQQHPRFIKWSHGPLKYHYTVFSKYFASYDDKPTRKKVKQAVLKSINSHIKQSFIGGQYVNIHNQLKDVPNIVDELKASEGHMIAMEFRPHWKYGSMKLPVVWRK